MLTNDVHPYYYSEKPLRTGMYKWSETVFKDHGTIRRLNRFDLNELDQYDIVQMNVSGKDLETIPEIIEKTKNTSTKLVINWDYAIENFSNCIPTTMRTLFRAIKGADCYFATEKKSAYLLSLIADKEVTIMPHPCDVQYIKSIKPIEDLGNVMAVLHRYNQLSLFPYFVFKDIENKTYLANYQKQLDPNTYKTEQCYYGFVENKNWTEFLQAMKSTQIIYDTHTCSVYGRIAIESAALGIPTFGSNLSECMERLWPQTQAYPYDLQKLREIFKKLHDSEKFRNEVVEHAQNNIDYYDIPACKNRYMTMIEAVKK